METKTLPSQTRTLLIVDDEPLMTELLQQSLSRRGYRIQTASSALEALQLLATTQEPIDLVITDVTMPEMDGIAFVAELAQQYPALPVIVASGIDASASPDQLPSNVRCSLQKPYQSKTLLEQIRAILP